MNPQSDMKGTFLSRAAIALLVSFSVAACSNSEGPSGRMLDESTSLQIATELTGAILAVGFGGVQAASDDGHGNPLVQAVTTVDISTPCKHGGTIDIDGTVSNNLDDEGTGSLGFDLFSDPRDCVVNTNQGNFTVNGTPNLRYMANWTLDQYQLAGPITMSFTGALGWDGDDGSGQCTIMLTYDIDYANPADSSYSGSICGHSVP